MGLGGVISNLLALSAKLLPVVSTSPRAPSSPSPSDQPLEGHEIQADLQRLMRMLEGIEAKLYDAEERVIRDRSVKLWLKELKQVAYDAEDVLDEYHYEVLREQVEARDHASPPSNPRKRKQVQVPENMCSKIKEIMQRFDEIERDRRDLRLFQEDAPRRVDAELQMVPTSHFIAESNIFGREKEKRDLIELLSSECPAGSIVSVVTIIGVAGLGKTTLAQLVYNDQLSRRRFDKFGWVCVSEDFNVQRLTREAIESITGDMCGLENLSALHNKISEEIRGQRVLLVLDDVWNENMSHWEKFQAPFRSATLVKILVTTRNERVAQIMQTMSILKLGYLPEHQCWQLFKHYAFGQVNEDKGSNTVFYELGKQIMKKCGMLPLAVKSIASLLRHEIEKESWEEILNSELWESDARNEIFPSLQISYARLPTYLKPCFLYCSIFPKDHNFRLKDMVHLWASQGYIKLNRKKNLENIGWRYAMELLQRSLLECTWRKFGNNEFHMAYLFKLHDVVHDLARLNSDNGYYSIEAGKVLDFPHELYHLYVGAKLLEPLSYVKVTALRTLIIVSGAENVFCPSDLPKAYKLRALDLSGSSLVCELQFFSSRDNFKHLRHLLLDKFSFEKIPECICTFYNLQSLTLLYCECLQELPKGIGNLISLQELTIKGCFGIRMLPVSFHQLQALKKLKVAECYKFEALPTDIGKITNLQTLSVYHTQISYLPFSLRKLAETLKLKVSLHCESIGWLKDLVDLRGNLCLSFLAYMYSLTNIQCAPLASMHNLVCLELYWFSDSETSCERMLHIAIKVGRRTVHRDVQNDFAIMSCLQPHPNLRELYITGYDGVAFPEWIKNPTSCASLSKIEITHCIHILFLPLGGLCNLRYLKICCCFGLRHLNASSLPLQLRTLIIDSCERLKYISGVGKLKFLDEISIRCCCNLQFVLDAQLFNTEFPYRNSLLGLRNLTSLRSLQISGCSQLQIFTDELPLVESCKVEISDCPGLKEWCFQHNIAYKIHDDNNDDDDGDNDGDDDDDDDVGIATN